MQLQIKHLAPYLPYNLQVKSKVYNEIFQVTQLDAYLHKHSVEGIPTSIGEIVMWGDSTCLSLEDIKPLLHPLENLLHNYPEEIRDEFSKMDWVRFKSWIEETSTWLDYLNNVPSLAFIKMIELKYDVFRLIPQGLALDINTVVTK